MQTSRNLQLYSLIFLFLSTFTLAWPWPKWLPELDALVVRQNSGDSSASPTGSASPQQTASSGSGPVTFSAHFSGSDSPQATGGSNSNASMTSTTPAAANHTSFDPRLPAGGVSMVTPAVSSGEQYFKIGDFVTFAWNYTSLLATPTAINVMATCTANQQLYTIAMNQTIANSTNAVTWDTGSYQATAVSDPLLTETYTLIIYDAESSISAVAEAGYLASFDSYTFGMYSPQAYTPLGDFQCVTCSGALSDMERKALGMMFGVAIVTVLSFTWFVTGTGVIW